MVLHSPKPTGASDKERTKMSREKDIERWEANTLDPPKRWYSPPESMKKEDKSLAPTHKKFLVTDPRPIGDGSYPERIDVEI